jgi:cytochrome P450
MRPSTDHDYSTVLRLYPSVPINSRAAVETTTLPTGGGPDGKSPILVKKGAPVGYCVYAMHRRKDLYGSDADEFRPERWDPNEDNEVCLKNIGWGYLPFNGGPRVCLGRKYPSNCAMIFPLLKHQKRNLPC